MLDRLADLEHEFVAAEAQLADPALIADQSAYTEVARRYRDLESIVVRYRELQGRTDDLEVAREMLRESSGDDRETMRAEVDGAEADIERLTEELRVLMLPKDPNDGKNVIVEIRGAEGGEEANLFARDLFDMYRAYSGRKGWRLEVLGTDPSDMGGYNEVTFLLKGDDVWTHFKFEGGPHRVQRVPVTESQGRIHTSSSTVTVLPEAEEVEVDIDPNDLQIDVYRSSGPGGQGVNTTDSAVRITHLPSGIVVSCQNERSQLQNREQAMRMLRARLIAAADEAAAQEASAARRSQVRTVDRSERIRTYNYPENRIADHRIGYKAYNLDQVLNGDLQAVVDALQEADTAERLAAGGG